MSGSLHRVYFALRPDEAAAADAVALAERLRRKHALRGRPIPPERLHVSLNWLGSPPSAQTLAKAREAIAATPLRAFVVNFNRVASFSGRVQRPLVLWGDEGVIGVDLLHAAIHSALAAPGVVGGSPRAFEPHMTLLWDQREVAEEFVEPVSWRVRELVLIDSGEGRHELLGRWPLDG